MNERIKELAVQANIEFTYDPTETPMRAFVECWEDELDKFAELIVKECLDIALEVRGDPATDTHYVIGYDRACEKMISGIKEHFGVDL